MYDYTHSSDLVLSELLRISSGIVWKNPKLALAGEENVDQIYVEQYKLAKQGKLTFELIYKFDEEALISAGLSEELAVQGSELPVYIPENMRDRCTQFQIQYIIDNYIEKNNYYRMLNGLPDLDDTSYVYNTKYPDIGDPGKPIHEYDISDLYALNSNGYIQELIEANPNKKYLEYLLDKRIDIITARTSDDFSILYLPSSEYENLLSEFKETYNVCRFMTLNVYYYKSMDKSNTDYTGFVGMIILFATLNQMHRKMLDADITREFFDEDSLRYVYDSYGVPYYSSIPVEYHKKIVKNMNILISHKGSTNVFYDVFNIFGFDAMNVFEYYMMKVHKFDEHGKPIFEYNEDGSYDLKKMYDVYFAKVKLYDDPTSEMKDNKNKVGYNELIRNDAYWINDSDLINKIYSEEYNYMESKYLGIQTMFNLMKILYESAYYIKFIIDNRKTLERTAIYNNNTHTYSNLFELVIYTCALISKKYGFAGNIPSDPHEIGKVMGFNFVDSISTIKNNISENDYLKNDNTLLEYLKTLNVYSLESVNKVYTNLTELRKYLVNKMAETDNVDVYWSYYELYQTLMYSEYVENVFVKDDGEMAESFEDLLSNISPSLYTRYNQDTLYNIDDELSDTLYLLQSSCNKLKYFQYSDSVNIDTIIEYMFKLLEFFKSAKADLTGYEVIYSLVSNSDNILKLMNIIDRITDDYTSDPQYSKFEELADLIHIVRDYIKIRDSYWLYDNLESEQHKELLIDMIDHFDSYIHSISYIIYDIVSELDFREVISIKDSIKLSGDPLTFNDSVTLLHDEIAEIMKYLLEDEFPLKSEIIRITESIFGNEFRSDSSIQFMTKLMIISSLKLKDYIKFDDWIGNEMTISICENAKNIYSDFINSWISEEGYDTELISTDTINKVIDILKIGKSEMNLIDNVTIENITLLYSDIEKNSIVYYDKIFEPYIRSYIDSIHSYDDILYKSMDFHPIPFIDKEYYYDFISESNSLKGQLSILNLNDYVFLRQETVYEE